MDCLNLPFTQFDSAFLETLPDEVFFAKRFKMSEEDEALLMQNSSLIHGRRFYRAKIKEPLMEKYAALTNPAEGEPGSKSNPLVRFGQEYVYSNKGELIPYFRAVILDPFPSDDQKKMIQKSAKMPIIYEKDCPKSSPERLQRFRSYGEQNNRQSQSNSTTLA